MFQARRALRLRCTLLFLLLPRLSNLSDATSRKSFKRSPTTGSAHGVEVMIESQPSIPIGGSTTFQCRVRSDVRPHIQWLKRIDVQSGDHSSSASSSSLASETLHASVSGFLDAARKRRLARDHVIRLQGELYRVLDASELLVQGDGSSLSKLVIEPATDSDAGKYICLGSNSQSYSFRSAFLSVERLRSPLKKSVATSSITGARLSSSSYSGTSSLLNRSHLRLSERGELLLPALLPGHRAPMEPRRQEVEVLGGMGGAVAAPLHHHHQHRRGHGAGGGLSGHYLPHPDLLVAGLPIVAGIAVASLLVLVVNCYKRRSEPHIPDLSDPRSDESSDQFPASNLTKELYSQPNYHLPGSSSPSSSSVAGGSSVGGNIGWFSINDDLYKNYCSIGEYYGSGLADVGGASGLGELPPGCPADLCRPQPPCCCVNHLNPNQL